MLSELWDFIVVGGGLAGAALSSRLSAANPDWSILLIEAGPDVSNNTIIPYAANQGVLIGSEWDWNYTTVPQVGMSNRIIPNPSGHGLGGGTIINSCGWIRGDKDDFDYWASVVGDSRWSYNGQLPYFKKMEDIVNSGVDLTQHGLNGPIVATSITTSGRRYPLREPILSAWNQSGIDFNPDGNGGNPLGVVELNENRKDGLRQLSSSAYPLGGVTVLTNTLVKKVLISKVGSSLQAAGVQLEDGTKYTATKEVIVTAGAYRTPQLLMLSGLGPKSHLSSKGITTLLDIPDLGRNLADHVQYFQYWKLKHPELGQAVGSSNPLFTDPVFGKGVPADWLTTLTPPTDGLRAAITKDEGKAPSSSHPLLKTTRAFMEAFVIYAASSPANPVVPLDGSHIVTTMVGILPTSRGTVHLASTNPRDAPVIDPRYLTTEVDKYAFRDGVKKVAKALLMTLAGNDTVLGETPPSGFDPISVNSTDAEIDARLAQTAV
jgi:choline dehydrogenase